MAKMKLFSSRIGVLVIILVVLFVLLGVNGVPGGVYRSQWEISTEVVAFDIRGNVTNPPTSPLDPGHWINPGDWTPPGGWDTEPGVPGRFSVYPITGGTSAIYDFDQADYGMPDVRASAGDIRSQIPSEGSNTLSLNRSGYNYVIEYREYVCPVQIRTLAGVTHTTVRRVFGLLNIVDEKAYITETAMPYEWRDNTGSGGSRIGLPIQGSVFVRVACLPYGTPDFGPAPSGYVFKDYWLGIINVIAQSSDHGIATLGDDKQPIPETHPGWERDVPSDGQPLTMWTDDGEYAVPYAPVPWDTAKILDPDIQSTIIFELPFDLKAGAHDVYNIQANTLMGQIEQVTPVDHYITVTVALECFLVKEYAARAREAEPVTPIKPRDIAPPTDWAGVSFPSFWDQYGFWIILGIIFFVIVMIVMSWITLPLWVSMMTGGMFGGRR